MKKKSNNNIDRYQVKIIRETDEIDSIRDIWEEMQFHPNVDIDFYLTINDSRKNILRPYIVVLYRYGSPVSMIIGRIMQTRVEIKIGYKTIFKLSARVIFILYPGILGYTSHSCMLVMIRAMIKSLKRENAHFIYFNQLSINLPIYKLIRKMPNVLCRDYYSETRLHWKMKLPDTIDTFYKTLTSKHRYNLKRLSRKIEKKYPHEIKTKYFEEKVNLYQLLEDAEIIARTTYQRGLGEGFCYNSENYRRLKLLAVKGWLEACILYIGGQPCSFWIATIYRNTFYTNFTGYKPEFAKYEPGTLLFLQLIEKLCTLNIKEIDFGFGDAFYKKRFGSYCWREASISIYSSSIYGTLLNITKVAFSFINQMLKRVAVSINILNIIKKNWRRKLAGKRRIDG